MKIITIKSGSRACPSRLQVYSFSPSLDDGTKTLSGADSSVMTNQSPAQVSVGQSVASNAWWQITPKRMCTGIVYFLTFFLTLARWTLKLTASSTHLIQGTGHIRNRWVRSLVVQGWEFTNSFWSHRPDSFVHFGPPSHSDWAGGHVQWQHGRPQQVYQEHVQKCALHRKKVASIIVESLRPFSEPQIDGQHQP